MHHPEDYLASVPMRYYLMLGYMIFFLPRASRSEELMELCKATVLRKDSRLFPEQSRSAQRAIRAYVERMAAQDN